MLLSEGRIIWIPVKGNLYPVKLKPKSGDLREKVTMISKKFTNGAFDVFQVFGNLIHLIAIKIGTLTGGNNTLEVLLIGKEIRGFERLVRTGNPR